MTIFTSEIQLQTFIQRLLIKNWFLHDATTAATAAVV